MNVFTKIRLRVLEFRCSLLGILGLVWNGDGFFIQVDGNFIEVCAGLGAKKSKNDTFFGYNVVFAFQSQIDDIVVAEDGCAVGFFDCRLQDVFISGRYVVNHRCGVALLCGQNKFAII